MAYTLKKAFKYLKWSDIGHCFLFLLILPWALIAKIFIRDFWLVCEDKNEARDNGYHFFKWLRANHPEQKTAYAINKKSPDYQKVKDLGKIISYGTLSHWFWYIVADKNISSQKGGKPNAAVCYLLEVVLGFRKNNRVFLQHGIIGNKCEWLYYPNTKMRLFMTSTTQEYEFLCSTYGYPDGYVKLTGLSRFDNLDTSERDEQLILVMPTWRNWLGRESSDNKNLDFTQTDYYKSWNAFFTDNKLLELLEKYDKKIIFYPHRNMQKFLNAFGPYNERIIIADWKNYDIQSVLKKCALMITDYSSVYFDFAYMRKPVVFYQFDEQEYREKQYGVGYVDYKNTPLGQWAGSQDELLVVLKEQMEKNFALIDETIINQVFPFIDKNNSQRVYDAIKSLEK